MSIDIEEVRRIARLARLELSGPELESHARQLARVLDHVRLLGPAAPPDPEAPAEGGCPLREDLVRPSLDAGVLLQQAPHQQRGWFALPLNRPDPNGTVES